MWKDNLFLILFQRNVPGCEDYYPEEELELDVEVREGVNKKTPLQVFIIYLFLKENHQNIILQLQEKHH